MGVEREREREREREKEIPSPVKGGIAVEDVKANRGDVTTVARRIVT